MTSNGMACYRVGDLWVDVGQGEVRRGDTAIPLPRLSFDLLLALIEAAPNLASLDELMRRVWPGLVVSPETVSQRVKLLRRALGDDPNSPRYVLAVRGRGYRLVAPVESVARAPPIQRRGVGQFDPREAGAGNGTDGDTPNRPRRFRTVPVLIAAAVAAGVALAFAVGTPSRPTTDVVSPPSGAIQVAIRPVVAVLPFANPGVTESDRALADGLRSDIVALLSRNHSIDVVTGTSVERYRDRTVSATQVGQDLGATHVLEGRIQQIGHRIRVRASLHDTRSATQLWTEDFDREFVTTNLFAVQGEIVLAIAKALHVDRSETGRSAGPAMTQNIDAWAAETTARGLLGRRTTASILEAERLFRHAITLDPHYARAYAGLADVAWLKADYSGLPWLPSVSEAERLANHALRLDPNLVEALATRAKIAQERLDFATAEEVYRRIFELNPSYASAYHWYAQLLYQQGREVEARNASRRAVDLDPMSALKRVNMGLSVAGQNDLSESLAWMEKAREIDPNNPIWADGKSTAFAYAGRYDEALHWGLAALDLDPRSALSMVDVARWHLELDDLRGARTWISSVVRDGRQARGSLGHAGLLALYAGASAEAVEFARRALALDPHDTTAFRVLDADAFRRGDPAPVIAAVRSSFPELAGPEAPRISRTSLLPATDLALALQRSGDTERSKELLDAASDFLATARRNGSAEYLIDEARVAAIRGDREAALRILDKLVADGWRGPYWRHHLHHDAAFDGLRKDLRFQRAFAVVAQEIRSQRARAERTGDLRRPTSGAG